MTDVVGASAGTTTGASTGTTTRYTEAVPLSLSSMAHTALPLEDGVLDGLKNIIQHTLWCSLSYAQSAFGRNYSPVDLCTSPSAWEPTKLAGAKNPDDAIPSNLRKQHGFDRIYQRTALVYLRPAMDASGDDNNNNGVASDGLRSDDWTNDPAALIRINFLYAATGEMTPEELDAVEHEDEDAFLARRAKEKAKKKKQKRREKRKNKKRSADEISTDDPKSSCCGCGKAGNDDDSDDDDSDDDDDDAAPPAPKHVVLYRATIEYRSLPATGSPSAVRAEELSMLSFGGSLVDDDVKYGALSSLYDDNAKYVLEILGVRGKKYRLDLMDATLSDGTVPSLPTRNPIAVPDGTGRRRRGRRGASAVMPDDPFVKTLCVTVSDHAPTGLDTEAGKDASGNAGAERDDDASAEEKKNGSNANARKNPAFSLTTMRLSLEGGLRVSHLLNTADLPPPNYYPYQIQKAFLSLRSTKPRDAAKAPTAAFAVANQPDIVAGMPSGHRLLLDPAEAGKVYIHGRYVTTWGKDPRIGGAMGSTALFGMDLHSVPYWHGRIVDYDRLMVAYATLWTEILTDARLIVKNIGGRLLSRLITGSDPLEEDAEDDDDDTEDDDEDEDTSDSDDEEEEDEQAAVRLNTNMSCLESQVMASSECDPVGISAKALATKFQNEYGPEGYPCLTQEMDWVKDRLPGRVPVAVPQRLIDILRRGGFFDVKRTSDDIWFSESRPAKEGTDEAAMVKRTCKLLVEAECNDVQPSSIVFGKIGIYDPVQKKGLVRHNQLLRQYCVNQAFPSMDVAQLRAGEAMDVDDDDEEEDAAAAVKEEPEESKRNRIEALAAILGMYIAREHPDGNVLMRYVIRHMVKKG